MVWTPFIYPYLQNVIEIPFIHLFLKQGLMILLSPSPERWIVGVYHHDQLG